MVCGIPIRRVITRKHNRPVVVLDDNTLGVLSVKSQNIKVRQNDPYDVPIIYWEDANLRLASTARISKKSFFYLKIALYLKSDHFIGKTFYE